MIKHELDTHTIRTLLEKICQHESFLKSPRYTSFITYLVEQALEGNDLKERSIGMALFEKNYREDKSDGTVRVYMYNLRKKLQAYYAKEGKTDKIVFVLEKGSYNLRFVPARSIENSARSFQQKNYSHLLQTHRFKVTGFLLTMPILLFLLFFLTREELYCWQPFLNENNNLCILADQVILRKKGDHDGQFTIHEEINNSTDYIRYKKQESSDSLQLLGYSFFTKAIPTSIHQLAHFFATHQSDFSDVLESVLRFEDTKRNNILYIGQHKTMGISKELFLRNSKIFTTHFNFFSATKEGTQTFFRPRYCSDGIESEYAMVSFFPLEKGNHALYFVSNNDIGTMATVKKFTDLEFVKQFYNKLPSDKSHFNALFKVHGVNRTEVSCELVELEVIE